VNEINNEVLRAARDFRPDLVWAEKMEYLRGETLEDIRRIGARLVQFTPDPSFSVDWKRTPLMDQAPASFDVLVLLQDLRAGALSGVRKAIGLHAAGILL
jgi:hypothetical protein